MQQTACSLLHYLPEIAEFPFHLKLHSGELPDRMNEGEFWRLIYHCMATTFVANLAQICRQYHHGISARWVEVGEAASKALVALGNQGFWSTGNWYEFFRRRYVRLVIIQPTLDIVLNEMIDAVLLHWADGRMWHRRRKPDSEVAFRMVKTAVALRFRLRREEPAELDEILCRAFINTGNLQLLRESSTEVRLQVCTRALQEILLDEVTGHGSIYCVPDGRLEEPLKLAIFEMGLVLGKTAEELRDITTYHGPTYDDFS